ncbi:DUF3558 domain-containing protein [Amycolatopsis sp. WAC 01376]|uniref:DUF3558 domain-containing protein n=1 Tax=Amycolatopsis sp. WAC 01376 TaxID=2203195 RepID=UPI000F7B956F|nr:DUF3558 domain-containing protein [Amycolatopsis sp. WAC 01376]RSM65808.1 DUF3558 domain-containing protein [Amycolatopsis sp. WAC 01376]
MRRATLILSAAALAALSACSTPTVNGSPTPTSSGPNPGTSNPTSLPPGVPRVEHPIDVTRFKQSPCTALTKTQVEELLGPGAEAKPRDESAGPACAWTVASFTPRVSVIFGSGPDGGTASVYAAKGNAYKLVEPLEPLDGYPVTAYGVIDRRAEGACSVSLGISDTQTIGIALTQSQANVGKKDPCDAAREGAVRVLATIRGGN